MPIEVPSYINVSRIDRNKNFIEIGINNTSLSISVTKNEIAFSDELEEPVTVKSRAKQKTVSVSPSEDDPLPKRLAEVHAQTVAQSTISQPILNQAFGQPIIQQVPVVQQPVQTPIVQPQVQPPIVQTPVRPPVGVPQAPVIDVGDDEIEEKPAPKKKKEPKKKEQVVLNFDNLYKESLKSVDDRMVIINNFLDNIEGK